jgi:anti-anti-sigma regulatory factor
MPEDHVHDTATPACPQVQVRLAADSATVVLSGEFGTEVQSCLEYALRQLRPIRKPVTVDAQDLTFISSSAIVTLGAFARAHSHEVTLRDVTPSMLLILQISTLIDFVTIEPAPLVR